MTLERKNTGRSFRLYYDHFQNRSKYIRDTDSVKCKDRVLSNRRICNVLNISTRHGPIRYAFISNSKWIPKRALSFPSSPCPISIQIQLSFGNLEKSIRESPVLPRIFKPRRIRGDGRRILRGEENGKKHVWHTPPLTETIDRNSSERRRILSARSQSVGKS